MANDKALTFGMNKQIHVTPEQMGTIKSVVFPGATDDELKLFLFECGRRGTHPMERLIHPVVRYAKVKDKDGVEKKERRVSFQCSIDYYRAEGETAGDYAGIDAPAFGPMKGGDGTQYPEFVDITVYRWMQVPDGTYQRVPFVGRAYWKEYYPGEALGHMWRKMPSHMLAKCAEALARRKAWPQRLAGLYVHEEMVQAVEVLAPEKEKPNLAESVQEKADPIEVQGQTQQGEGQTVDTADSTMSIKDQLKRMLNQYCADHGASPSEILKEVSKFGKEGSEKWIKDINKASDNWCANALKNLKNKVKENAGNIPESCTKDPQTCDYSAWVDGLPTCSPPGVTCKFYNPEAAE